MSCLEQMDEVLTSSTMRNNITTDEELNNLRYLRKLDPQVLSRVSAEFTATQGGRLRPQWKRCEQVSGDLSTATKLYGSTLSTLWNIATLRCNKSNLADYAKEKGKCRDYDKRLLIKDCEEIWNKWSKYVEKFAGREAKFTPAGHGLSGIEEESVQEEDHGSSGRKATALELLQAQTSEPREVVNVQMTRIHPFIVISSAPTSVLCIPMYTRSHKTNNNTIAEGFSSQSHQDPLATYTIPAYQSVARYQSEYMHATQPSRKISLIHNPGTSNDDGPEPLVVVPQNELLDGYSRGRPIPLSETARELIQARHQEETQTGGGETFSPRQERLNPKDVEPLNGLREDEEVDPVNQPIPRPVVESPWLDRPYRHISRELSSILRILTHNPFLPLFAILSQVSFANASSDGVSEFDFLPAVPLSAAGLATILSVTPIYTLTSVYMNSQFLVTRAQHIGSIIFLQLLAYICSLAAQDTKRGGQGILQLSVFLAILGLLPFFKLLQTFLTSPEETQRRRGTPPFHTYGGCQKCGKMSCSGDCGSGSSTGNEDRA